MSVDLQRLKESIRVDMAPVDASHVLALIERLEKAEREAKQAPIEAMRRFEEECKTNGHSGESFGMAISGPTECSDVAPCLKAARAVFSEAARILEYEAKESTND